MSTPSKRVSTPAEQNMISNALGLQIASYKRAINSSSDPELKAYYEKQLVIANKLVLDINNVELF